jgi:hypothetical protein
MQSARNRLYMAFGRLGDLSGLAAKLGQNLALVGPVAAKIALEFKTKEEVVFIRGYIAYDRLVRAPRPTRDGR